VVNDPTLPHWCNLVDVASGGAEVAGRLLDEHGTLDALVPYNDETMLGAAGGRRGARPDGEVPRHLPQRLARGGRQGARRRAARDVGPSTRRASAPRWANLVVRHFQQGPLDGFLGISPGRPDDPRRQPRHVDALD